MFKSYNELNSEELFNYNFTNFVNLFESYRGNIQRDDDVLRCKTEIPGAYWSGILKSNCTEDEADVLIEKQLEYFRSRGHSGFMWYVLPSTNPKNMKSRLEAQGFLKIASSPMMSIDLHDLPEQKEIPGLEIKPVRNKKEMKIFDKVLETQFKLGEAVFKKIYEIDCSRGFEEDCSRQLYVAYQDRVPVSTNFMFLDEDVAGLYKIATHPDYCRKGIGTAVTLAPLYEAKERGYNVGIIQSTEAGYNVYRKLGFKEDGILDRYMYTWDKEAKSW